MKILHISIPKNAGTFIANKIISNFDENREVFIMDLNKISMEYTLDNLNEIVDRYNYIAGHFPISVFKGHLHKFDLIISSYRNPWYRAYSYFKYETKDLKLKDQDEVSAFSHFCASRIFSNIGTRNHQCGFLGWDNTCESAMNNIEDFGIKVLPVNNLDSHLRSLFSDLRLTFPDANESNSSNSSQYLNPGKNMSLYRKIFDWYDGDFALCDYLESGLLLRKE